MGQAPSTPSSRPPLPERRYRSLVLLVVMMGVTIAAVDTTIVVLGLPVMMTDLHTDILSLVWVIMAYLLTLTILSTQVGKLGDMYGRVRMYNAGFAIFTLGSVLCGLSRTGGELVAFRVLQAVGGALISSNSGAIIADTVPSTERGRAYGLTAMGWSLGAVLGILLGGVIVTYINWRYIFFINLPIGVAALVLGYTVLKERSPRVVQPLDIPGALALGGSLLLILLALSHMTGSGWTAQSAWELAVGFGLLGAFLLWEGRVSAPLMPLSLFQQRVLTASVFAAFFQALGGNAVMFLIIMYLQGVRGLSAFAASLLLVPGYLLGGVLGPWSGRLADRYGARWPASLGLLAQAVGFFLYAQLSTASALGYVVAASVVTGAGNSFFFPSNSSAVMAAAPPRAYGLASGVLRTLSNIGMVSSFAVALLIAAAAIPRRLAFAIFLGVGRLQTGVAAAFVHGLHAALLASIGLLAVALLLSVLRGAEIRRAPRLRPVSAQRPPTGAVVGGVRPELLWGIVFAILAHLQPPAAPPAEGDGAPEAWEEGQRAALQLLAMRLLQRGLEGAAVPTVSGAAELSRCSRRSGATRVSAAAQGDGAVLPLWRQGRPDPSGIG